MSFGEALKLFGLKVGFTEKDLKRVYRKMLKKYHSDQVVNSNEQTKREAEKKIRDINVAHDILLDYVSVSSTGFVDIDSYRNKKINELNERGNFSFSKYKDISSSVKKLLEEASAMIKFNVIRISYSESKQEIDELIDVLIFELEAQLKNIKSIFYRIYEIDEKKVSISLNYRDNLESFYCSLLDIKEKYGREALIIKQLDSKLSEYRGFVGYDRVELIIEKIRENYIKKIKKNIPIEMEDFSSDVLETFNIMYSYEKKINDLVIICVDIDDDIIKQKLEGLKNKFKVIESFFILQDCIDNLELDIKRFQDKQKSLKLIPQYYGTILNRYTSNLSQLMSSNYLQDAIMVSKVFQKSVELLYSVDDGSRNIEDLELLSKVTFYNYEQDLITLEKRGSVLLDDIYIVNREVCDWDELLLGKIIKNSEEKVEMIGISDYGLIQFSCLPLNLFEEAYISFDTFLENNEFCGYKGDQGDVLLYFSDYVSLFSTSNLDFFLINVSNNMKKNVVSDDSRIQAFRNKKLLKQKIIEFLDNNIKEWEKSEEGKQFKKNK